MTPREPWFQLKLAAHYELEQYPLAATTLEIMISKWPEKKTYWTQLSQIYLRLKQDDRALAVQALAYRNGLLDKQADLLYLSSLYSQSEIPYKAAEILQLGIESGLVEDGYYHWTVVARVLGMQRKNWRNHCSLLSAQAVRRMMVQSTCGEAISWLIWNAGPPRWNHWTVL